MDQTHFLLDATDLNEDDLLDAEVYGADEEKIGSISHLHETADGEVVVVDVSGFLTLGPQQVALPASAMKFMRDQDDVVFATTTLTRDQAKALPEHVD